MASTQKVEFAHFSWINVEHPTTEDMNQLGREYKFHPLDLADCLRPSQRSKIDVYSKYNFFIFLFPRYIPKTREIVPDQLNIFIGKNFLITIQHDSSKIVHDFFELFRLSTESRNKYTERSPEKLFYELIQKLMVASLPMMEHLIKDSDAIEKAIFSGQERKMVSEILIIRRNITNFRKIMSVHKSILKKALATFRANPIFVMKDEDVYFESLIDYAREIWDGLENMKERIETLQQANESQISFQLSDIMRILTVISVIIFPLTLIASIFGMNTVASMPLANNPYAFWYVLGLMIALALAMVAIFKKKGWM